MSGDAVSNVGEALYSASMLRLVAMVLVMLQVSLASASSKDDDLVAAAIRKSNLREKGSKPFTLLAHFSVLVDGKKIEGTYSEYWLSPEKWRREISSHEYSYVELRLPHKAWD